jgi:hypothetical protein
LYGYAADVPINSAASWFVEVLAITGTTDRLVHCLWPMTARDDEWLVTKLCAGFLQKSAEFNGDITLSLVYEAPAIFS